jgi:hypothetical protein
MPRINPTNLPAASALLYSGAGKVVGWAFRETTGTTTAVIRLWDGTANTGRLIAPIALGAGQSTRDSTPIGGILTLQGVYFELVSGTVEGSVWIADTDYDPAFNQAAYLLAPSTQQGT